MKLTFEGTDFTAITVQVIKFVTTLGATERLEAPSPEPKPKADAPANAKAKPDAAERMAKARAAKGKKKAPEPKPEPEPSALQLDLEDAIFEPAAPASEPEVLDAVTLTAIRVKTTEDLQAAYSEGKHTQVLALLAKFGNGAKSFRELQIRDFVPIRKAIDEGALKAVDKGASA